VYSSSQTLYHTATGNSHAIWDHTPDRGAPLPPAEAGTQFSDPGGMQGWVDICYMKADRPGIEPQPVSRKCKRTNVETYIKTNKHTDMLTAILWKNNNYIQ